MRQEKKYRQFEVGERVIARDYRGKDPWVAGNISEREGPLMYKVATDKGQIWRRHTEQLKATKMEQTREAPNVDDCIVVHDGDEQSTSITENTYSPKHKVPETTPRHNPRRERNPPKRLITEI